LHIATAKASIESPTAMIKSSSVDISRPPKILFRESFSAGGGGQQKKTHLPPLADKSHHLGQSQKAESFQYVDFAAPEKAPITPLLTKLLYHILSCLSRGVRQLFLFEEKIIKNTPA
jgi:hypothetical protein